MHAPTNLMESAVAEWRWAAAQERRLEGEAEGLKKENIALRSKLTRSEQDAATFRAQVDQLKVRAHLPHPYTHPPRRPPRRPPALFLPQPTSGC